MLDKVDLAKESSSDIKTLSIDRVLTNKETFLLEKYAKNVYLKLVPDPF